MPSFPLDWSRRPLGRLAVVLACLAIMALLWHDYRVRHRATTTGDTVTAAVLSGKAAGVVDEEAEDQALWDDDSEAGEMWAAHNPQALPQDCPRYNAAFHLGCTAAIVRRTRR